MDKENFTLNINKLYKRLKEQEAWSAISITTDFLMNDLKINPLEYVTKVYPCMYAGLDIESIEIPNSIKYIGDFAFGDCKSLKSVTISNSVEEIDYRAFFGCGNLQSVIIPNSVREIGTSVFSCCWLLKTVEIPGSVAEIGYDAFYNCPKDLTIKCKKDSCADKYAKEHKIKVRYID